MIVIIQNVFYSHHRAKKEIGNREITRKPTNIGKLNNIIQVIHESKKDSREIKDAELNENRKYKLLKILE